MPLYDRIVCYRAGKSPRRKNRISSKNGRLFLKNISISNTAGLTTPESVISIRNPTMRSESGSEGSATPSGSIANRSIVRTSAAKRRSRSFSADLPISGGDPPPTAWHRFPDVHWSPEYLRKDVRHEHPAEKMVHRPDDPLDGTVDGVAAFDRMRSAAGDPQSRDVPPPLPCLTGRGTARMRACRENR